MYDNNIVYIIFIFCDKYMTTKVFYFPTDIVL